MSRKGSSVRRNEAKRSETKNERMKTHCTQTIWSTNFSQTVYTMSQIPPPPPGEPFPPPPPNSTSAMTDAHLAKLRDLENTLEKIVKARSYTCKTEHSHIHERILKHSWFLHTATRTTCKYTHNKHYAASLHTCSLTHTHTQLCRECILVGEEDCLTE